MYWSSALVAIANDNAEPSLCATLPLVRQRWHAVPNPGSRARSWPKRACELQIPVDGTARIDRRWLAEQYLVRHRSYTDIAAQLGVTDMTVIAAARRHHIPSRPSGVHS